MKKMPSYTTAACLAALISAPLSFGASLINDDFSSSGSSGDARFRENQADAGWYRTNGTTLWQTGGPNENLSNAGTAVGAESEAGFGQLVSTTGVAAGETLLTLSFDYALEANVTLFVHLTGWSTNVTTNNPTHTFLNNSQSAGGNIQNQGDTSNYADMNLIDGTDANGFNTTTLTGSGTYSMTFDVSGYVWAADESVYTGDDGGSVSPGFSGTVGDLTAFDYIQLVFATDISDNTENSALAIDNVLLTTAVPEPGAALLLVSGMGLLALPRRRA